MGFALRTTGVYDVEKLWHLTRDNPVVFIHMKDLVPNLDDLFWETDSGRVVTPRMVMEDPQISPGDTERILDANLGYPILVYKMGHMIYDVIDGLHRLSKAFLQGHKYMRVIMITPEQLAESET